MRYLKRFCISSLLLLTFVSMAGAGETAIEKVERIIHEIVEKSYPELKDKQIQVKTFQSESDYFRSGFSFARYLTFQRMRYVVFVNPQVFERNAPQNGVSAIIAHELGHVLYYAERNRFQLLGLAGLSSRSFTQRFERKADLDAIARGYGKGLIDYRKWLYQNIPTRALAEKERNYFTPEEIDLILKILKQKPEMMEKWRKRIPLKKEDLV